MRNKGIDFSLFLAVVAINECVKLVPYERTFGDTSGMDQIRGVSPMRQSIAINAIHNPGTQSSMIDKDIRNSRIGMIDISRIKP